MVSISGVLAAASIFTLSAAQTFQRLGGCPTLGCVLPPDQTDFLAGQYFDIRLEVHAPVNGSEANGGVPDPNFAFTIAKANGPAQPAATYFKVPEPELERWNFTWYEDLFAQDAHAPSVVRVTSKAYRRVALYEPGEYVATLTYYNGTKTVANWIVRPLQQQKKAKNVILFIGDGMTTNMITAARLIAHKSINGKYQSTMMMDKFPVLGHQMTHSLDSYITDSANSASALYSGHKSTVNAMGVYADSSPDLFDDPKVETIVELLTRVWGSAIGVVSTAFVADATPIALTGHSRSRYAYGALIDQALRGVTNYTWTKFSGPDVFFGTGAEQFLPGSGSYQGKDYYAEFSSAGYSVSLNKTSLLSASNTSKALGIFSTSTLPVWLDRNVYKENLETMKNDPSGNKKPALDLPGLKEMTLKAIDILHARGGDKGFFMMSEAASIDKQMHTLDYDRALGDLLELDDTVKATVEKLKAMGELNNTLILVTADHGHGFDVFGSADTKYLSSQTNDRDKRNAIGTYASSGLSQYTITNASISYNTGVNFPVNWDPRYTLAQGVGAMPDHRENYRVHKDGPRLPATNISGHASNDYYANPKDNTDGFIVNGTIPTNEAQGVHSLTDVPVFAMGPCQELFGGVYGNIDIFFNMANCLGLARADNATGSAAEMAPNGSTTTVPATGAAPKNGIQRGLTVGMLVFQLAIGWVAFNL
ncbi:Alkaline phosphatase-like protein [Venustampulla echinocandica]|uniref:alkaline phosphatase n=1 Tax=Venustampulla echinocandica TaxID=2656787 RepID=A0A370TDX4_9HELO|nr:Alkaline phosphatase-like protein [Venustampulla echinocandica]RDL32654.1 Alkaline phosphatase-like protein [Venustampulla echinocandica]